MFPVHAIGIRGAGLNIIGACFDRQRGRRTGQADVSPVEELISR